MIVKRGDIYYADLSPVVGSEQGGMRPVLIVQNDVGNKYSPTVIAAAITSKTGKTKLPTHIDVAGESEETAGLARDSVILLEQVRTIDKKRLRERIGHLDLHTMQKVNSAISVSLGLYGEAPLAATASVAGDNPGEGITAVSGDVRAESAISIKTAPSASTVSSAYEIGKSAEPSVSDNSLAAEGSHGNSEPAHTDGIPHVIG